MTISRVFAVIISAVSMLVIALPAANASWSECNSSYVCLWGNNTYSGSPWWEERATGNYNTGFWDNDETSSVANRSTVVSAYLFNDTNTDPTHGVVCLPRGYSAADLNNTTPEFDDRISSMRLSTGACAAEISKIGYPKSS